MIAQKWCNKGQHYVDPQNFAKSSTKPCGLSYTCKDCRRKYREENAEKINQKKKLYRESNTEKIKDFNKISYEKNKAKRLKDMRLYRTQNADKLSQKSRDSYLKNKEKLTAKSRKYYEENKPIVTDRQKSYYQNNKSYFTVAARQRKSQVKNAKGQFTNEQWLAKLEFFGNRCYLCKISLENVETHIEHRIPISRGGTNFIANIAPACKKCNLKKHDKTEKEYRKIMNVSFR